ncbi:MAG TPA: BadF/BadG/BcrA/BcrD ATPase family protein [Candidatus Acidoferrales bacterium]|nr:BadF/BadG/BcrA/BcrD ATPase family protein [Candidatus Acidoferrales bacterium]
MAIFLGFDAGATKTDCVLIDGTGRLLSEARGGGANPLRSGFAKACGVLGESAQRALAEAHERAESVRALCAGIAGAGRPRVARRVQSYFSHAFPQSVIRVTTDIEIALEAGLGEDAGIVVIAGTGSAACGRNSGGQYARAGGWGPWIGDDGSAYDIGRRAVYAALRARDSAAPASSLAEKILLAEKARDWDVLIERVARRADKIFPQLFAVVREAADEGDAMAQEILTTSAKSLATLAQSVIEKLGMREQVFSLVKSGGAFGHSTRFDSALEDEIMRVAPGARPASLRISPARAAAEMARKSLGNVAAHGA